MSNNNHNHNQKPIDQFLDSVHYDKTGDWKSTPETSADPDDEADKKHHTTNLRTSTNAKARILSSNRF